MTPQQPDSCRGCPLYGIGTGFVLGDGDPETAKIALLLEAPGKTEVIYGLLDNYYKEPEEEEVNRRRLAYPDLEDRYITRGKAVVGAAGFVLFSWGLAPVGITRRDLFIDNTLRCLPPKEKGGNYPTGNVRKKAEAWCRQYDRIGKFRPTTSLIQIHPAAIAREITPLPLMIKTFEKAKLLSLAGEKPVVLCGGKAVHNWLGFGSTVQTWLGHIQPESDLLNQLRENRWKENSTLSTEKVKKVKKPKAKDILKRLISEAVQFLDTNGEIRYKFNSEVSEEEFGVLLKHAVPTKPAKEK